MTTSTTEEHWRRGHEFMTYLENGEQKNVIRRFPIDFSFVLVTKSPISRLGVTKIYWFTELNCLPVQLVSQWNGMPKRSVIITFKGVGHEHPKNPNNGISTYSYKIVISWNCISKALRFLEILELLATAFLSHKTPFKISKFTNTEGAIGGTSSREQLHSCFAHLEEKCTGCSG